MQRAVIITQVAPRCSTLACLVLAFLMLPGLGMAGTTRVWTNSVAPANWSNASNWVNGVPVDGDGVLLLRHPLGFSVNAVNDLTNLHLTSIRCEALGYTLSGGLLHLSGEVRMGGPVPGATLNISAPVQIPGPSLDIVSTNSSELVLSGVVTAPSNAVVRIQGGIRWRASAASDYRAETRLEGGSLLLLFTRIKGALTVGGTTNFASVALQSGNLFGEFPPLTLLTNSSLFNVSTFNAVGPLTLDGGTLRLGNRSPQGDITVNGDAVLRSGRLILSSINSFGPGSLSVTGKVILAGCSLELQDAAITKPCNLIQNDGVDPVAGTFSGRPEGSILTNNTVRFVLSYVGGDGNDVTLTPIVEPPRFLGVALTNRTPQFLVQGQPGFLYSVETSPAILPPPSPMEWTPLLSSGTRPDGQFTFIDPDATNTLKRFYRIVTQ